MNKQYSNINISSPGNFTITVKGKVDAKFYEIIKDLSISYNKVNNEILSDLKGVIIDQAELLGILNMLYNMRLPIINVTMDYSTQ